MQIKRSLLMAEQGGAVSRVSNIEVVEGELLRGAAKKIDYRCRWNVTGTVEHWGHIHTRVNQYEARFAINATPRGWKITGYEVSDQKRLKSETGLRTATSTQ